MLSVSTSILTFTFTYCWLSFVKVSLFSTTTFDIEPATLVNSSFVISLFFTLNSVLINTPASSVASLVSFCVKYAITCACDWFSGTTSVACLVNVFISAKVTVLNNKNKIKNIKVFFIYCFSKVIFYLWNFKRKDF